MPPITRRHFLVSLPLAAAAQALPQAKNSPAPTASQPKGVSFPEGTPDEVKRQYRNVLAVAIELALVGEPRLNRTFPKARVEFSIVPDATAEAQSLMKGRAPAEKEDAFTVSFKRKASDPYQHLVVIQADDFVTVAKATVAVQTQLVNVERRESGRALNNDRVEEKVAGQGSLDALKRIEADLQKRLASGKKDPVLARVAAELSVRIAQEALRLRELLLR